MQVLYIHIIIIYSYAHIHKCIKDTKEPNPQETCPRVWKRAGAQPPPQLPFPINFFIAQK